MVYRSIFEREIDDIMRGITVKLDDHKTKRNIFLHELPLESNKYVELFPEIASIERPTIYLPQNNFYLFVDLDGTLLNGLSMREARKIMFGSRIKDDFKEVIYDYAVRYGGKELGFTFYVLTANEIFRKYGWNIDKEKELVYWSMYNIRWNLVAELKKIKEKYGCQIFLVTGNAKSFSSRIVERINRTARMKIFDDVLGSDIIFDDNGNMSDFPKLVSNINLTVSIGNNGDRRDVRVVRKLDLVREELDEKEHVVITDSINDIDLIKTGFTIYVHDEKQHSNPDQKLGVEQGIYDILVNPNDFSEISRIFKIQ